MFHEKSNAGIPLSASDVAHNKRRRHKSKFALLSGSTEWPFRYFCYEPVHNSCKSPPNPSNKQLIIESASSTRERGWNINILIKAMRVFVSLGASQMKEIGKVCCSQWLIRSSGEIVLFHILLLLWFGGLTATMAQKKRKTNNKIDLLTFFRTVGERWWRGDDIKGEKSLIIWCLSEWSL